VVVALCAGRVVKASDPASAKNGAKGAYGATRAANADDTRWTGGRWYAILGFTVQLPVTTISFKGPMWGNFRFGLPAGLVTVDINDDGTSIFGTNKLSIDANEKDIEERLRAKLAKFMGAAETIDVLPAPAASDTPAQDADIDAAIAAIWTGLSLANTAAQATTWKVT